MNIKLLLLHFVKYIYSLLSPQYRKEYIRVQREVKRLKPKNNTGLHLLDISDAYDEDYFQASQFELENIWADKISAELYKILSPKSVVDFGCGRGLFLRFFVDNKIKVLGYEGSESAFKHMVIPKKLVKKIDLRTPILSQEHYDLAISFEVAEHIEREFAALFINNITSHSSVVAFTGFPPGIIEPHPHHPNEQRIEYWDALFKFFGFGHEKDLTSKLHRELLSLSLPRNLKHYEKIRIYVKKQ